MIIHRACYTFVSVCVILSRIRSSFVKCLLADKEAPQTLLCFAQSTHKLMLLPSWCLELLSAFC